MNRHRSTLAMVATSLICFTLAQFVSAAESDQLAEGRAHFVRGVEYYKDEDFRNAMVEFKHAYELAPNYKILYNLGQTAQELKDYAFALKCLEQYLAEGGNEVRADRRTEVSATVRKLKQRVAEVTLSTSVSDAEVFVDDVSAGRTPLAAPLVVSAGRRKIALSKGAQNVSRVVEVGGGEKTEISLEFTERPANSQESSADEAVRGSQTKSAPSNTTAAPANDKPLTGSESAVSESPTSGVGNAVWIGVAVTGALAVATGVTGILAVSAKRDFDSTMDRYPITPDDVSDARNKTRRLALVTDILGGAAILSCGVTIWIAASGSGHDNEDSKRVGIVLTPTGLAARGNF
ncbi:MAG: PEGA domain-containing protein [Myxococcales bacterium]